MTLGLAAGRRLFHPSKHLWLRARKDAAHNFSPPGYAWIVEIGLAPRGLADIGDVTGMAPAHTIKDNKNWLAKAGDQLVTIDWDAHTITSADELYHTVWETFSEQTIIRAPISGIVEEIKPFNPVVEDLDEDTVVVSMRTDESTLKETAQDMMDEADYEEFVTTIPPGKFGF